MVKERVKKSYRHPVLDASIRNKRLVLVIYALLCVNV